MPIKLKGKTKLATTTSTKRSSLRRKLVLRTSTARVPIRHVPAGTRSSKEAFIKKNGFQISGNAANPKVLFVVDPIITDFNKDPKGAINKGQKKWIGRYLKDGIDFTDVAFLTAAPPMDKLTYDRDKASGDHLKEHREKFLEICKNLDPSLIVAMGKLGARQVYGRAIKITKIRGLPENNEGWNRPIMPSLGLTHVMRYPENEPLFSADMDTVKRIYKNNFKLVYKEKIKVDYKWVDDLQFLVDMAPENLVVDIEGVGLDMMDPKTWLLSVQLCWQEGKAVAINIRDMTTAASKRLLRQLKALLENPAVKCIGHNLKFDFGMIREKLGIQIANYEWDTMVMAHIIDENMLTFNLADLTRRYVPELAGYSDEFDRDPIHQQKTRMDLVPLPKLLQYGCGDVDATFRLFHVLKEKFDEDPYFNNYYKRVIRPGLRAFCDIERYGFTIDKQELKNFEAYLRKTQKENYAKIVKMVPKQIQEDFAQYENRRNKVTGKIDKIKLPLNITRQAFLVGMCFQHPKGLKLKPVVFTPSTANDPDKSKRIPSTSTKEHFPYFEGNPFIDAITEYIKNEKLLTTYVGSEDNEDGSLSGFYKYIKGDGIRPNYVFTGTDTGRLSSRDPNGQNFPKRGEAAKRYRRMFVAPPGWVLVDADLSQIELRIAAYLANETTMLRYFAQGIDLHAATAARVIGKSIKAFLKLDADFVALNRFRAKAVNFGFLYGMWWRKFMSYAKTQYGVEYTEKEAEAVRVAFFQLYPGLEDWHKETSQQIMEDGYIRSPLGRIRHLPSVRSVDESVRKAATRKGINAPVQSFGSDLGVMAIGILHAMGIDPDKFRIIGFVHDDIICMAREKYAITAARTLKRAMETIPLKEWFDFEMPVKLVAEAAIGYNLSDTMEVNEYLTDKSIKTLDDLRKRLQNDLAALPDTEENAKKRKGIAKSLDALTRKEAAKPASRKRRIVLKSISKRSVTHANSQKDKATRKIVLKGRKPARQAA